MCIGVPAVPAIAATSLHAVRQPSRASQIADKPRSKNAAVALMFKGAKQGSASAASAPGAATGEAQTDSASCPHPLQEAHSSAADVAERNKEAVVDCGVDQVRESDAAAQASYHEQQGKSDNSSRGADREHGTSTAEMASGSQESGRDSDAQEMPDTVLGEFSGVDIAEQRQILHDLWLQRNASLTKAAVKRPAIGGGKIASKRTKPSSVQKAKQSQLSGLLKRTDAS